jgi:hypothetical protein
MKSKLTLLFLISGLFVWSNTLSQNQPVKNDTLTLLLNNSKVSNKNLFLVFGWQGCGWCRVFDKYHHDSIVNAILDKYFVIASIDIYKTKAGVDLYKTYGKKGTPSWTIFDLNGEVIIDSDNGKGNIGYPAEDNELKYYVLCLKKAVPSISESECDILVAKLKDYNTRKKQN